jgi:hypothetical protein
MVWGPIVNVDMFIGGQQAPNIPMQLIVPGYAGNIPPNGWSIPVCSNQSESAEAFGANGVLGLGTGLDSLADQDGGLFYSEYGALGVTDCALNSGRLLNNGTGCLIEYQNPPAGFTPANPLSKINSINGYVISLPNVPAQGAPSVTGQLIFGIGTQANNTPPPTVTPYPAVAPSNITTVFNGSTYAGVIDLGANVFAFTPPLNPFLPECPSTFPPGPPFLCPPSTTSLQAFNVGLTGVQNPLVFQIANAETLISSRNLVFNDIGMSLPGNRFVWGVPFFLGRNVYFLFANKNYAPWGNGPIIGF